MRGGTGGLLAGRRWSFPRQPPGAPVHLYVIVAGHILQKMVLGGWGRVAAAVPDLNQASCSCLAPAPPPPGPPVSSLPRAGRDGQSASLPAPPLPSKAPSLINLLRLLSALQTS